MPFPVSYDISYYKGDTFELLVYPKDSAGNTLNLSGYSGLFTISTARGDSGIVVGNGSASIVNASSVFCTIPATTGSAFLASQYVYDVQVTSGSIVYTLLTGNVNVTQDISGS